LFVSLTDPFIQKSIPKRHKKAPVKTGAGTKKLTAYG